MPDKIGFLQSRAGRRTPHQFQKSKRKKHWISEFYEGDVSTETKKRIVTIKLNR